jgi:RHS repeat-associated protein
MAVTQLARYAFDPWGRRVLVSGGTASSLGFAHHISMAGIGSLAVLRHYDADLGRWTTQDPIGLVDGPSLYAYVGNNPVKWIDPQGLFRVTTQRTNHNSVVCDGGRTSIRITTTDPCAKDCLVAHERVHERDINARNPGLCRNVRNGTFIAPDNDRERDWAERRACAATFECFARKLEGGESCDCRSRIEQWLDTMAEYCARFR